MSATFDDVSMLGIYCLHFVGTDGGNIVYVQAADEREAIAIAAQRVEARRQHFGGRPRRLESVHLMSDRAARRLLETAGAR